MEQVEKGLHSVADFSESIAAGCDYSGTANQKRAKVFH
jgi:hypothetical protein